MELRKAECSYLAHLVRQDMKDVQTLLDFEKTIESPHVEMFQADVNRLELLAERLEREATRPAAVWG